jgi:hypothetical protein
MSEKSITKLKNVVPPWIQSMRDAIAASVTPDDIKAMVQAQVKKAKDGDERATRFVLEHVLGGMDLKGATFIQKNYYGGKPPAKPA